MREEYLNIRKRTESICAPLKVEDYVVQPIIDVSPPKWHLGHTTWFFEEFFLSELPGYERYNSEFAYVFNSYYETVGARVIRTDRGNLSRPTVDEVYAYRKYVDTHVEQFLSKNTLTDVQKGVLTIGLNHEQQHQELLVTDIKYILGNNPLFPAYGTWIESRPEKGAEFATISEGEYGIGYQGNGFSFDNEHGHHTVKLDSFDIRKGLVTNGEFMEFMDAGGYTNAPLWHSDGIEWVRTHCIQAPFYWHLIDRKWHQYTLEGLKPVQEDAPLAHVSFYEAFAFAEWKGMRLPTEFEWEVAADRFDWGQRWEWTHSAYLPYPGYRKPPGAIGEYNGKFMVNQMVLRGASVATPPDHSRKTYRNFFHPNLRWQFTGIRLAK